VKLPTLARAVATAATAELHTACERQRGALQRDLLDRKCDAAATTFTFGQAR
jgi:hypothetical protein